MASIQCTPQPIFASKLSQNSSSSPSGSPPYLTQFRSQFLGKGHPKNLGRVRPRRIRPVSSGSRTIKCWFRFGKNGVDAEGAGIYGSQSRDDFDRDDVEQVLYSELKSSVPNFGVPMSKCVLDHWIMYWDTDFGARMSKCVLDHWIMYWDTQTLKFAKIPWTKDLVCSTLNSLSGTAVSLLFGVYCAFLF